MILFFISENNIYVSYSRRCIKCFYHLICYIYIMNNNKNNYNTIFILKRINMINNYLNNKNIYSIIDPKYIYIKL